MAGDDPGIDDRLERLETIAETLEAGEVGLATAKDLREEADEHLTALREDLDVGDGDIIELDADVEPVDGADTIDNEEDRPPDAGDRTAHSADEH